MLDCGVWLTSLFSVCVYAGSKKHSKPEALNCSTRAKNGKKLYVVGQLLHSLIPLNTAIISAFQYVKFILKSTQSNESSKVCKTSYLYLSAVFIRN